METTKFILDDDQIPKKWYNIQADMPELPDPPINPETKEPVGPEDLAPIFPNAVIEQEMSQDRWIKIPDEVREIYSIWRPTPMYRARRLEKALGTPAKIYYKWEGVSPPGSHKPNTAIAQAYYNSKEGTERLSTETGAGQWGSALAFGTSFFDIETRVYMVRVSYDQKPYRRVLMNTWGAECVASPSEYTEYGKKMLKEDPDTTGSLGMAIGEAIEDAASNENTKYSIGSVLNHVVLHQTVIGLEAKKQFEMADDYPDVVVGCVGGGSNFAGAAFPFLKDKLDGDHPDLKVLACEPEACPTLSRAPYAYDFGDSAGLTPLLKMYTLGHTFVPPPVHAGGLRYHGDSPLVCKLVKDGYIEPSAHYQEETFEAAIQFARTEGFVIAPEAAHAARGVIDEALECKKTGEEKTILFANSGHGHFDLSSYKDYLAGKLEDYEYPAELAKKALEKVPDVPDF